MAFFVNRTQDLENFFRFAIDDIRARGIEMLILPVDHKWEAYCTAIIGKFGKFVPAANLKSMSKGAIGSLTVRMDDVEDEPGVAHRLFSVLKLPAASTGAPRVMYIFVKGDFPDVPPSVQSESVTSQLPALQARSKSEFNNFARFYATDLRSGWELLFAPGFTDMLNYLRSDEWHLVKSLPASAPTTGLSVEY